MAIWEFAEAEINEWNNKEGVTSFMGHNEFSDWTEDEFKATLGFLNKGP